MAEAMTPRRLAEIRARCEAATEGPWICHKRESRGNIGDTPKTLQADFVTAMDESLYPYAEGIPADVAFIAHARTDVPDLCDALEQAWAATDST